MVGVWSGMTIVAGITEVGLNTIALREYSIRTGAERDRLDQFLLESAVLVPRAARPAALPPFRRGGMSRAGRSSGSGGRAGTASVAGSAGRAGPASASDGSDPPAADHAIFGHAEAAGLNGHQRFLPRFAQQALRARHVALVDGELTGVHEHV